MTTISQEILVKVPMDGAVQKTTKGSLLKKTPTVRTQQPNSLRRSREERAQERQQPQTVRALEKQMKDEKQAKRIKLEINSKHKRIEEEKSKQETLAAKLMSGKRLARM